MGSDSSRWWCKTLSVKRTIPRVGSKKSVKRKRFKQKMMLVYRLHVLINVLINRMETGKSGMGAYVEQPCVSKKRLQSGKVID